MKTPSKNKQKQKHKNSHKRLDKRSKTTKSKSSKNKSSKHKTHHNYIDKLNCSPNPDNKNKPYTCYRKNIGISDIQIIRYRQINLKKYGNN